MQEGGRHVAGGDALSLVELTTRLASGINNVRGRCNGVKARWLRHAGVPLNVVVMRVAGIGADCTQSDHELWMRTGMVKMRHSYITAAGLTLVLTSRKNIYEDESRVYA